MKRKIDRRGFLQRTGAVGTAALFAPSLITGRTRSADLRVAFVGVGGRGAGNLRTLESHPAVCIMALCDVDEKRLKSALARHGEAEGFRDWRKMLDTVGDKVDAVVVSTPDHHHAPVSMQAVQMGKHVYCEKPLCHELYEVRKLTEAARNKGVVTQMGIQIHACQEYRTVVKLLQSGVIGKIREVHSWSGKKWGFEGLRPEGEDPVPESLDWDLWLGVAPARSYKENLYHPRGWRRWYDFGCGTMGDMSVHILDPIFESLKLGSPIFLRSESPPPQPESFNIRNKVTYRFPGTDVTTDPLTLTWHDGLSRPDTTDWPNSKLSHQGSMFIGEKGWLHLPHASKGMQLLPEKDFEGFEIQEFPGYNHHHQWIDACLGEGKPSASFDYSGPLTEMVLLGVIANRVPKTDLKWDTATLRLDGCEEAANLVRREYREGWEIAGL